tara:strand:+ start:230 stop:433 length:204 start_codon:yes stop_codon:yes gene_type:complete
MKKLVQKIVSEILKYKQEIAIASFISSIIIVGVMMTKPKTPAEKVAKVAEVKEVVEVVDSLEIKDDN